MPNTASRLITLIFLLQNQPNQKAGELARKLGVSLRTIHRYFAMLDEMGIPVSGRRIVGRALPCCGIRSRRYKVSLNSTSSRSIPVGPDFAEVWRLRIPRNTYDRKNIFYFSPNTGQR